MSDRGIYVALSGALAQQTALEATAHDLANASTEGFAKSKLVFREVLANQSHFTNAAETVIDTEPGARRTTGDPGDFALPKGAFLAVRTERGERYTRACSLVTSPDGFVRTKQGHAVVGEDGRPLKVDPSRALEVTRAGEVRSGDATQRMRVVSFDKPERLAREDGALLASSQASGAAKLTSAELEVGAVEESNANVSHAMIDLVTTTRSFEAFQRTIDAFHDADRKAATLGAPT